MITRRRAAVLSSIGTNAVISVSRRAAFGDVIGSTVVVDELHRLGFRIHLHTLPVIANLLHHHKSIEAFGNHGHPCHINLDNTYDLHPERGKRKAMEYFYEFAQSQMAAHGIKMRDACNLRPQLNFLPEELDFPRSLLKPYPRPWVMVVPKSNHWPNRTLPSPLWSRTAANVNGTLLWTGTDRIGDPHIVDMRCKDMRQTAALVAVSDLVVGVDTGPMWCAVGFNRPILGVSQARSFNILFNDQVDWRDVASDIPCIGCSEHKCPINESSPPCQNLPDPVLSSAINERIETVTGNKVSAVIPCLHDRDPRILKCFEAVVDQVDEVVFSFDGSASGSALPSHSKLRIVRSPDSCQTGFGKTCNRGARASTGRYILFLNDDLYLSPGAVRAMKRIVVESDVAIVGGLWRYPDGKIQHGGGNRGSGDAGFGHLDWKKTEASIIAPTELEFVTAACMLVRREAFYQVGAFGEEFGNYFEDADLCMKVRKAGWKVMFQPFATGIHDESQTTGREKLSMHREAHNVFREKWQRYFSHNPPGRLGVFT